MTDRIRVSGFRRPIVLRERRDSLRDVVLIRTFNLIGLFAAAGVLLAVFAWGTPHVLLATRYSGFGAYRF